MVGDWKNTTPTTTRQRILDRNISVATKLGAMEGTTGCVLEQLDGERERKEFRDAVSSKAPRDELPDE